MKQIAPNKFLLPLVIMLVFPASQNYRLDDYSFGAAGADNIQSQNYRLEGAAGEVGGGEGVSQNFQLGEGFNYTLQSEVVPPPGFVNDNNYYNKLKLTLNLGNNPSDARFAVSISGDNWATTQYIQSDNKLGPTLGSEDWRDASSWNVSGGGIFVTGLTRSTSYSVKVKSSQGDFTESAWSQTASASTNAPTLTFDLDVSSVDTETSAPYTVSLTDLSPGSVYTAQDKIWIDLDSNAENGVYAYISSENEGLKSSKANYSIPSQSTNLDSVDEGYGLQTSTLAQASGGPLVALSPYNGLNQVVGKVETKFNTILSSSNTRVDSARASAVIKVKVSPYTRGVNDYFDVLTLVAAASF